MFNWWLLLLMAALPEGRGEKRGLTVITYRFTPCNVTGLSGPSFSQCSSYYQSISSPIHRDGLLNPSPEQQSYPGGQGFTFPRSGWYNITVAGASGGRGLCNPEKGKGVVSRGRLYIEKGVNDSVLVMVGQKGRGPCDVSPTHELCSSDLSNTTLAAECYTQWNNLSTPVIKYNNGGGSGGGASMLWLPDRDGPFGTSSNRPYVISGGGGGTSVELNYTIFILPPNHTAEEYYRSFINANYMYSGHQRLLGVSGGHPGGVKIPNAGAGGGYLYVGRVALAIDGKSISRPNVFAEGGMDCAEFHSVSLLVPFKNVIGGFGGGGGACSEGGGGGGYTGGSVLAARFDVPGGGGFSYRAPQLDTPEQLPLNDGDGYVDIVASDCGCADECVLDMEEAMFDCKCTSSSSHLAPDGFDCFTESILHTNQSGSSQFPSSSLFFSLLILPSPITLYSMNATLSIQQGAEEDTCAIIWLGEDVQPVLATSRSPGAINTLSVLTVGNNTVRMTPLTRFLLQGVTVACGLVVSTAPCSIENQTISVNISIQQPQTAAPVNLSKVMKVLNGTIENVALQVLGQKLINHASLKLILLVTLPSLLVIISGCVICAVTMSRIYRRKKSGDVKLASLKIPFLSSLRTTMPNKGLTIARYIPKTQNDSLRTNPAYIGVKTHIEEGLGSPVSEGSSTPYDELRFSFDGDEDHHRGHRKSLFTFRPLYGVMPPYVDFTLYNAQRTEDDWVYDRGRLVFLREIGEGEFGKVLLMRTKNIAGYEGTLPVAVKTLSSTDEGDVKKFLEEVDLMKRFCHPNIVSLLGVNCDCSEGAPLMILEYMPFGDLRNFLKRHGPNNKGHTLISKELQLKFAEDIAKALNFLECKKYVHRDVAARNCLIGPHMDVKLADFGMARGVQEKDYYCIAGQAILPVRWMAPESLVYGMFTSASDVWSYGVVLWEIATFGASPLANKQADDIIQLAESGKLVHTKPVGCCMELYTIMAQCHNFTPEHRPTFSQILFLLPSSLYNELYASDSV